MTLVLTSVAVGIISATLAGIGAAVLTTQREHQRWLRETRLNAYSALLTAATQMGALDAAHPIVMDRYNDLERAEAQVLLVGPPCMDAPTTRLFERVVDDLLARSEPGDPATVLEASTDADPADLHPARRAFIDTARAQLYKARKW